MTNQDYKQLAIPNCPICKKKYQIIYADPPWRYDFSATHNRDIENQYPTMELEEIKSLKIPSDDNSVLYLWATSPKLLEALDVMKEWGFKYRTHLIWDKEIIGCGWWFRGQHELLLVGVKGKFSPPENKKRISSVFKQRRTKHSKKPDIMRKLIGDWFPDKTKIELFARKPDTLIEDPSWKGWDVWGNEVKSDIKL